MCAIRSCTALFFYAISTALRSDESPNGESLFSPTKLELFLHDELQMPSSIKKEFHDIFFFCHTFLRWRKIPFMGKRRTTAVFCCFGRQKYILGIFLPFIGQVSIVRQNLPFLQRKERNGHTLFSMETGPFFNASFRDNSQNLSRKSFTGYPKEDHFDLPWVIRVIRVFLNLLWD